MARTKVVTSHLPAELAAALDELAERLDRPKGWIVKEAVASYISLEDQRYRMTLEALDDVSAKRVHEHSEITTWARSLGRKKRSR